MWFLWPASFILQWRTFGPITGQDATTTTTTTTTSNNNDSNNDTDNDDN